MTSDPLPQPNKSAIRIERAEGELVLFVPALSLWKTSGGLSIVAILCFGLVIFLTLNLSLGLFPLLNNSSLAIGTFVCGLIVMAVICSKAGHNTTIGVSDGYLWVSSPEKTNDFEWKIRQLDHIRVATNDEDDGSLQELQIHPIEGKPFTCLRGYAPEELDWIADQLRRAAGMTQ